MEQNKLIAEFMGGEYVDEHLIEFKNFYSVKEILEGEFVKTNCFDSDNELQYHTSWDWLMPVHRKCMLTPQFVGDDQLRTLLIDAVIDADIDRLYEAVVEFLNQYKKED